MNACATMTSADLGTLAQLLSLYVGCIAFFLGVMGRVSGALIDSAWAYYRLRRIRARKARAKS